MNKTVTSNNTSPRARTMRGVVLRRSGDKTIAVAVHTVKVHPVYHKRSRATKIYLVHDPRNKAQVGENVTIRSCRPLSARKRWILQDA
ncbi:MAG: 30S ribosomal protein S17 [Candidatus Andersenbacteria bacterium]